MIRRIQFYKGINLIVDETKTDDRTESGNSVGKTTVLRLIDFCLGGDGKNIYVDPEFKATTNLDVESFLKKNNVVVTLKLADYPPLRDNDSPESDGITIRRNFLSYGQKIQEVNGEQYSNPLEFGRKLKELIFESDGDKPTFRQIIAKNIRDEKNRLVNTLKVLHPSTTSEVYESVYLFWLGIDVDDQARKSKLAAEKKLEMNLQKRLRKETTLSQIEQSLMVLNRSIELVSKVVEMK